MGRSVSRPSNTAALVYTNVASVYDENDEFDEDSTHWRWRDFEDSVKEAVKQEFAVRWRDCDEWRDEDHGVLKCDYALFGYSEYCGLVSVWLVPIEPDEEEENDGTHILARGLFLASAQEKLERAVGYANGDESLLRKVGTFSNGEGVYERAKRKAA